MSSMKFPVKYLTLCITVALAGCTATSEKTAKVDEVDVTTPQVCWAPDHPANKEYQLAQADKDWEFNDLLDQYPTAAGLEDGFTKQRLFPNYGIKKAVSMNVASDGRIFVTEGSGVLLIFNDENDTNPGREINRGSEAWWDFIWSSALDPNFPAEPYIYVLLTDKIGSEGTHVIHKLTVTGKTTNWPGQEIWRGGCVGNDKGHHGADLEFGPDGKLYFTVGEGSTDTYIDMDYNGCWDGGGDEVGSWRSQDAYHLAGYPNSFALNDPTRPNGAVLRINKDGTVPNDNPWSGGRGDDDAIIAYGLRNPFKMTVDQSNNRVYIGDIGDHYYEEINRVWDPTDSHVENWGWPCFEGTWKHTGYKNANMDVCNDMYWRDDQYQNDQSNPIAHTLPWYMYEHPRINENLPHTGDNVELSSITAIEVYEGNSFPSEYHGALFYGDHELQTMQVIKVNNQTGELDPSNVSEFLFLDENVDYKIVDLHEDSQGNLYYIGYHDTDSRIWKLSYTLGAPALAVLSADTTEGHIGTTVNLDGSASQGSNLQFAWDLDNDGNFDDGNTSTISYTFNNLGVHPVALKVTDSQNREDVSNLLVTIHDQNYPTVNIDTPSPASYFWRARTEFTLTGSGLDENGNPISGDGISWTSGVFHCQADNNDDCHVHPITNADGTDQFSITPPEHDLPSRVNITISAESPNVWAPNWWNYDWNYRRALFLDNREGGQVTNYTAYVKLNGLNINYAEAGNQGASLRFIDAAGNELAYDVESWDTNGDSIVWVNVPSVAAGSYNTYFYMYYGNANANAAESFITPGFRDESIISFKAEEFPSNLVARTTVEYFPETSTLSLNSTANGSTITINGGESVTPYSGPTIVNNPVILEATETHTVGGTTYKFVGWSDGETDRTHSEFAMPEAGYSITANYEIPPCTPTYNTMNISGIFNGWVAQPMVQNENCVWEAEATFGAAGEGFKFRVNDDWSINFGDNNGDGFAGDHNGENLGAPSASTYTVWYNDTTTQYGFIEEGVCTQYPEMYISGTSNSWIATPMTKNEDECVWEATFTFDGVGDAGGPDRFKFRPSSTSWEVNFGDPEGDGIADTGAHAQDTQAPTAGTYLIVFDDKTKAYVMMPASADPIAVISPAASEIRVGDSVTFDGSGSSDSDGTISSYLWSNGDTTPTTTITYNAEGSNSISLTVTDDEGNTDTATATVNVTTDQPPVAAIGVSPSETVIVGTTVTFTDDSTDDDAISSRSWTGDVSSTSSSVTQTFSTIGTYTVNLTVTDTAGQSDSDTVTVNVTDQPDALKVYFKANGWSAPNIYFWAVAGTSPAQTTAWPGVTMTEVSGVPGVYEFEFNAGATSANVIFNKGGSQTGNLSRTADTDAICWSQTSGATGSWVSADNCGLVSNAAPTADAGSDQSVQEGQTANLSGTASDSDGSIASYEWTLNGSVVGNSQNITTAPLNGGSNVFTLTATDNQGATATDTVTVTAENVPPTVEAGSASAVDEGQSFIKTGTGSDAVGNVSYAWRDVNGILSNSASFNTQVLNVGNNTVWLDVTDDEGVKVSGTSGVLVQDVQPTANAGEDKSAGASSTVTLIGQGSDGKGDVTFSWFGPGLGCTSAQCSFTTPAGPGDYVYTLTVTDDEGNEVTDTMTLTVTLTPNQPPVANAGNDITVIAGEDFQLDGSGSSDSDGTITTYHWLPGNLTGATPTHSFSSPGSYDITLTVTDNEGATGTDTVTVTVEEASAGVPVTFTCNNGNTTPGISVYVVGDQAELGNWTVASAAQKLDAANYPTWSATITMPPSTPINWKCVKASESTLGITQWQGGGNNQVTTGANGLPVSTSGGF